MNRSADLESGASPRSSSKRKKTTAGLHRLFFYLLLFFVVLYGMSFILFNYSVQDPVSTPSVYSESKENWCKTNFATRSCDASARINYEMRRSQLKMQCPSQRRGIYTTDLINFEWQNYAKPLTVPQFDLQELGIPDGGYGSFLLAGCEPILERCASTISLLQGSCFDYDMHMWVLDDCSACNMKLAMSARQKVQSAIGNLFSFLNPTADRLSTLNGLNSDVYQDNGDFGEGSAIDDTSNNDHLDVDHHDGRGEGIDANNGKHGHDDAYLDNINGDTDGEGSHGDRQDLDQAGVIEDSET